MARRADLLRELIRSPAEVTRLLRELSAFDWDSETELVQLRREDVVTVLGRYVSGELGAAAVEGWADAIEVRDDVGFGVPRDELLRHVIHVLANPILEGPLCPESARRLCSDLS